MKLPSGKSARTAAALTAAALLCTSCPAQIEDVNVAGAVQSDIDYSFVVWRIDLPASIPAGQMLRLPVQILNNGRKAWKGEDAPYFLSYHWKHPGGQFNSEMFWGARTPLPDAVGQGEIFALELLVTAPADPKYYDLIIDVVRGDGFERGEVYWFEEGGGQTHDVRLKVVAP